MAIQVRDSTEFKRLLEAIALELVDANIAFTMHTDLIAAYEKESREVMRQAWTFLEPHWKRRGLVVGDISGASPIEPLQKRVLVHFVV